MLENGYGEHNIQGIGDKHIPLIHNVHEHGCRDRGLRPRHRPAQSRVQLPAGPRAARGARGPRPGARRSVRGDRHFRASPISSPQSSSRGRRAWAPHDAVVTVATDSARLYETEVAQARAEILSRRLFTTRTPRRSWRPALPAHRAENVLVLGAAERRRIFNLGYYTWVEQQGVSVEDFDRRKDQAFWRGVAASAPGLGRPHRRIQRGGRGQLTPSGRERCRVSEVQPYAKLREKPRAARPQPAREGDVALGGRVLRAGRHDGRRRRIHHVAHADGDDLGADPSGPQASHGRALHRLDRRRLARSAPGVADEIVTSWFAQGILWGLSKVMRLPCRERRQALPGMEPHGDGHAVSRRRHGRALHADPLDAGFGRAQASARGRRNSNALSPARSCCSCQR